MSDDEQLVTSSQLMQQPLSLLDPETAPQRGADGSLQTRHGKTFNDPVHGHIYLSPTALAIVDTPVFQRTRYLKQLGCTYFVYPGAMHNRFEHSIGVAFKAWELGELIYRAQKKELGMDRNDVLQLQIAGLCHDLGHGPYSHVFDREFLSRRGITDWEHEDMSCKLFDYLLDEYKVDTLDEVDVRRIKSFITTHSEPPQNTEKKWMYEVVANWRNGLDVDKFDYLARDSLYCRVPLSCDFNRMFNFVKVIGDEICYKYSEWHNLHDVYYSRAKMHRQVYTHRKAKGIEFMVVDALLAADRCLKFSEKIYNPAAFVKLDDTLLRSIANFELFVPDYAENAEYAPIVEAQKVIKRLECRELYKYVNEIMVPPEMLERRQWKPPTPQDIANYRVNGDVEIHADDVIISETKIDFAMKDKNPLELVHFFKDSDSHTKLQLRADQVTNMAPERFMDHKLRIYSKNNDPMYCTAVGNAFDRWRQSMFGEKVSLGTPFRDSKTRKRRRRTLSFGDEPIPEED